MNEALPISPPLLYEVDPVPYTKSIDVLRSWFWRTYDHLGHLLLYNLCWFFGLWFMFGFAAKQPALWWPLFYILACSYSIGWATLVFRRVMNQPASMKDLLHIYKRYFLKAIALCLLTALVLGLVALNLMFYARWQGEMKFLGWVLTGIMVWLVLFWTGASVYQWPLLFFQDPPIKKLLYRSFLLFLDNSWMMLFSLVCAVLLGFLFTLAMIPWALLGPVFFFSFQCVALEKHLLRYKITFEDCPVADVLKSIEKERQRSWREFFKPWESR